MANRKTHNSIAARYGELNIKNEEARIKSKIVSNTFL